MILVIIYSMRVFGLFVTLTHVQSSSDPQKQFKPSFPSRSLPKFIESIKKPIMYLVKSRRNVPPPSGPPPKAPQGDEYIGLPPILGEDYDKEIPTTSSTTTSMSDNTKSLGTAEDLGLLPTSQAALDTIIKSEILMGRHGPNLKLWMTNEEQSPNGIIWHYKELFRNNHTTVYTITENNKVVVKYHLHCSSKEEPLDTTVVDFWFLSALKGTGIAIDPVVMSGAVNPSTIPGGENATRGKTNIRTCGDWRATPSVRYMVIERVGESLEDYTRRLKSVPFFDAIRIGGQMIGLLEKLHGFDFIHGDAHVGNFAFKDNNKLVLIDFGRARIINEEEILARQHLCKNDPSKFWLHPFLSWGEVQNCPASYRDDVYRAMVSVGIAIHGLRFFHYMNELTEYNADTREGFIKLKEFGKVFEIKGNSKFDLGRVARGLDSGLDGVRSKLGQIMEPILKLSLTEKPDYKSIKNLLMEIINLGTNVKYTKYEDAFMIKLN